MRIALCIAGQPRGLNKNIRYLLDGLIIPSQITDIFIHTWFDESMIGKTFQSAQPAQSGNLGYWDTNTIELLNSLNPKKILVEKPKDFEEFSHLENLPSAIQTHLASNAYSIYMANKLKCEYETEHNFKYDIVIRTRIDCRYNLPHNILDFIDENLENSLYVPEKYQHMRVFDSYRTITGETYGSLSDTFAYGSSNIIDIFSSVYTNFEYIHSQIKPYQYGECFFGYKMRFENRIPIIMKQIDYVLSRD
jgi:hypothetical protein